MEKTKLAIERIPISSIVYDPSNARKHSEKNLAAIKGSLTKFGQQKPIVIDAKNIVIAGNGTVAAAQALGWDSIDVVRTELTGPEAMAFALADNRSSELAEWDVDILSDTLKALKEINFDIEAIGFEDDFIKQAPPNEGLTDDDEVPEVPQNIHGVVLGDIWQLGEHRLMCGDSTDVLQVEKLMNGEKADAVYTDPPYGMFLDTKRSEMKGTWSRNTRDYKPVAGDDRDFDPTFILGFFGDCAEIFLWGADYYAERLIDKNEGSWVVWDKRLTEELDAMWGSQFELCWSKNKHKREIARITWAGVCGHNKKDDGDLKVHPTMKPVKLHAWFFEKWFKGKSLVVDLFLGSGSTLIACEKTNRKCYGSEIDPHYCSVIIERWQNFTGKKAKKSHG